MKTHIAAALTATALFTGAAQAMTANSTDLHTIQAYAPNADVSGLTAAQAATLVSIIHGGDSEGEKRSQVRAALR